MAGSWSSAQSVVRSQADFERFFEELLETSRPPLVVATLGEEGGEPAVDLGELTEQLGDAARVFVLVPQATFWLTDRVTKQCSVHSGWLRVYPAHQIWRRDPYRAPIFRPIPWDRTRLLGRVVDAVLDVAFADGYRAAPAESAEGTRTKASVDDILSPTQVLVRADKGTQAIMRPHHLRPGLPADRLVRRGQCFEGRLTGPGMLAEFVPDCPVDDPLARAIRFVGEGIVTSAKVGSVSREQVELLVHPDVAISVTDAPVADLTTIVAEGEVVTAEIIRLDDQFVATFSSDEPEPAMAALPGGPPWIVPVRTEAAALASLPPDEPEDMELPSAPSALEAELERLEAALRDAKETIRLLRRELREKQRFSVPRVFASPEDQLRLELHLAYLCRVDEADRARFPWPEKYKVGGDFLATLDDLVRGGGIARERVIEVCAEVLCGAAKQQPARAVKEWRESIHGPALIRPADGAKAMRVRLQTGSNAARRLRYWVLPSGEIELDRVGVHDQGL